MRTKDEARCAVADAIGSTWFGLDGVCARMGHPLAGYSRKLAVDLERLHEPGGPQVLDLTLPKSAQARPCIRTIGFYAIWRLFWTPDTQVRVLSSDLVSRNEIRDACWSATRQRDLRLQAVSTWPQSNVLRVADQRSWKLTFVPRNPRASAGYHAKHSIAVILGAETDEPDFCRTREVIEANQTGPDARTVRVWFTKADKSPF